MTHEEIKQMYDEEMHDVEKYMRKACESNGPEAEVFREIAAQELHHAALLGGMI